MTSTAHVSRAEFAMSGKITRLGLVERTSTRSSSTLARATSVYAQSEVLTLAPYPVTAEVNGDQLPLAISPDGLYPERRLIVTGRGTSDKQPVVHEATLISAQADPNGVVLTITPPLPAALTRETVVVHANVALATHGETGSQILGAGDASRSFQQFELKRLPLTYRSATNETGADSELHVRIGDVEWDEKPTLFGAAATERAYTLSVDEQGTARVVCGDGVRGARLPSAREQRSCEVSARPGPRRQCRPRNAHTADDEALGLKSVSNPVAAQGGTDPEPADQARRTMPLGTRTLGRAVSLLDYEDFALAFTGVAKAQARVLQFPAGPTIAITVAGQNGAILTPTHPIWINLLLALKTSGDPHVSVTLLTHQATPFHLGLKVKRDPAYDIADVLAAVEAAVRTHYSFAARDLAQPVLQSDVIATVQAVPGVVAVDLDLLYGGTSPIAQTLPSRQTRLLASRMHVSRGAAQPAELLTLHTGPLDRLEEMP